MSLLLNNDVPDVSTAERLYETAFGLVLLRRWTDEVSEMAGWLVRLFLLGKRQGSVGAAGSERSYARHWTPVHYDLLVEDVAAACARALDAGASMDRGPTKAPFGKIAMLADPFGNGFRLLKLNSKGYEASEDVTLPCVAHRSTEGHLVGACRPGRRRRAVRLTRRRRDPCPNCL